MNFKIFVKLFILMVVFSSCGKMDNLASFSKRKYLKNFPKQNAVKEKKTIDYISNENTELYASTELNIEEYLVQNIEETPEKQYKKEDEFNKNNLQFVALKNQESLNFSNDYKIDNYKISKELKRKPNEKPKDEPKDYLITFLVLAVCSFISIALFGWEFRQEKRISRISKKNCVKKGCNDSRDISTEIWGPIKLFNRSLKFCRTHLENHLQIKHERFEKRNQRRLQRSQRRLHRPKLRKGWFFVLLFLGSIISLGLGYLLGIGLSLFITFAASLILGIPYIIAVSLLVTFMVALFGGPAGSPQYMALFKKAESLAEPAVHVQNSWLPALLNILPFVFSGLVLIAFIFFWLKKYKELTQ